MSGRAASAYPAAAASLARRLAGLPGQTTAISSRATRLVERIESERFHIAVLGDFKRGKSTLVNALIAGVAAARDRAWREARLLSEEVAALRGCGVSRR